MRSRNRAAGHVVTGLVVTCATSALAAPAALASAVYPYPNTVTGDTRIHDPSYLVRPSGTPKYAVFSTGYGIDYRESPDRQSYSNVAQVFPIDDPNKPTPAWWTTYTGTEPPSKNHIWAPDVTYQNGKYWLYYAVSRWMGDRSAIGLATSISGKPGEWQDNGIVMTSYNPPPPAVGDPYNALGPNLLVTPSSSGGRWWLAFGSYHDGIYMVEINPATGKRLNTNPPINVAQRSSQDSRAVEGASIYYRAPFYYLFVSFDRCCDLADSDYNVRVGRSTSPTGPYVDRDGLGMLGGGGTLLLQSHDWVRGPGAQDVFLEQSDNRERLVYGYWNRNASQYRLGINFINWSGDDWPWLTHDFDDIHWSYPIEPGVTEPLKQEKMYGADYLTSPNSAYNLTVTTDCRLVERTGNRELWSVGTPGSGCRLTMRDDGNLVLRDANGAVHWSSNTVQPASGGKSYRLWMQNDGNLVIYGAPGSGSIWSCHDDPQPCAYP